MTVAPETVTLRWCPVCGRNDRYAEFTGKRHYSSGKVCAGSPIVVTYVRTPDGLPRPWPNERSVSA